tara:strand:+ start:443 stop:2374 length:1932 start_codon:yes stop_codon:yes gene_type:complete
MQLSVGISLTYPGSAAASLTGAEAFLADYSSDGQGYAHYFSGATPSVKIRDTATPANNVDTSLASFDAYNSVLTYTSPSPKNVMQSDGYVKYSAHNFARYSEDATNVVWRFANTGMNSADGDVTTAPDGSATADGFTEDTSTGVHRVYYYDGSTGLVAGLDYRLAFRIKGNGRTKFFIQSPPLGNASTAIDLVAVTSSNSNWSITALPDDWFLVEGTATASASGAFSFYTMYDDGSGTTYTGDGTSGMYWWGLQLHRAPADETYLPTTSTARYALPIEYDTSGDAIGVLVEPAATNLFTDSRDFSQSSWAKNGVTVTVNDTTDASGGSEMDLILETATNNYHGAYDTVGSLTTASPYTISTIVKKHSRRYIVIGIVRTANTGCVAQFDFDTGAFVYTFANGTDYALNSTNVDDLGGGFYRISAVVETGNASDFPGVFSTDQLFTTGTLHENFFIGDITKGFYADHMQFEAGSVATSPIVTAGSTVTRAADDLEIATSAFPLGSAHTIYAEWEALYLTTYSGVMSLHDGTTGNRFYMRTEFVATDFRAQCVAASVTTSNLDPTVTLAADTFYKTAFALDTNDFGGAIDGGTVATDASGVLPTGLTKLNLMSDTPATTAQLHGHLKAIAYIPERITDANLVVMTT